MIRAIVLLGMAGLSWSAPADVICSPAKDINSNCEIVIQRDNPMDPLPVRLNANGTVTLRVTRHPLEIIQINASITETQMPDVASAILGAFVKPLGSVVADVRAIRAEGAAFPQKLNTISDRQQAFRSELEVYKSDLDRAAGNLRMLQNPPGKKTQAALVERRNKLVCEIAATGGSKSEPPPDFGCGTEIGVGVRPIPVSILESLDDAVKKAQADFEALSPADQIATAAAFDQVRANQDRLDSSVKSLQTAQALLVQVAAMLQSRISATATPDPLGCKQIGTEGAYVWSGEALAGDCTIKLPRLPSTANRDGKYVISAKDAVSGASTPIATVVIHWGGTTRWETSTGIVISTLDNRSFAATPVIAGGQVQVDANMNKENVLSQTITRPTVVPVVFAHYRFWETARGANRMAGLFTVGAGVNPYSLSADFAAGATFAFRNIMISPVAHFGRDLRLIDGFAVGEQLGASPPSLLTQRYWVTKFGIALTYRLPIN